MKPAKLTCPYAKYGTGTSIQCTKLQDACAHQRFCIGKGWCVLTEQADRCPERSESHERKAKTTKKRRNKV